MRAKPSLWWWSSLIATGTKGSKINAIYIVSPGHLPEEAETERAGDGVQGEVFPLEQCSGSHHHHSAGLDCRQPGHSPGASSVLAGSFQWRIISCSGGWRRSWLASGLTPEILKKTWDGITIPFRRWLDQCNKCIRLNGGYVEKPSEINTLLTITVMFLFTFLNLMRIYRKPMHKFDFWIYKNPSLI